MKLAASRHRLQRVGLGAVLGIALLGAALPGGASADDRDPALAPPLEELEAKADRWRKKRQTGALVLLGSLVVASVVIGWARHRARRAHASRARVDKDPPPTPR